MTVGLVAVHYPRPEHRDEMISRVRQAAAVIAATPGCLAADCWLSGEAVLTTGQWETEQACAAGSAAARAANVDFDYDDRESRPRQIFRLTPAPNGQ